MEITLPWNGDISFGPNGDLAMLDGIDWAAQKLVHRLLTNPAIMDARGNPVRASDDPYNPFYGAGLTGDVGSVGGSLARRKLLIESAVRQEPLMDPDVPPTVQFYGDATGNLQYVVVQFQTITGETSNTGIKLN